MIGLVVALLILFAAGCAYQAHPPTKPVLDFDIDDPELEAIFWEAAQAWMDAGVVNAARLTVNQNPKAMKIRWSTSELMPSRCNSEDVEIPEGSVIGGCSTYAAGKFGDTLWITKLENNRPRLKANMLHELIHVIVPTTEHLTDDEMGIMDLHGNSLEITQADIDFVCSRTECA